MGLQQLDEQPTLAHYQTVPRHFQPSKIKI